jgi:transposase
VLRLPSSVRIFLAAQPTDMRKGFDGLSALVKTRDADVLSGHLFVFVSRRGDRVKVLNWDRGGFVLRHKRLERGRFRMPAIDEGAESVELDSGQLGMLLDGVDLSRVRRQRVWELRTEAAGRMDRRKIA